MNKTVLVQGPVSDVDELVAAGKTFKDVLVQQLDAVRVFKNGVEALTAVEVAGPVLEQAQRNARARLEFLNEVPAADAGRVVAAVRDPRKRPDAGHGWRREGRVFAVSMGPRLLFPLFQFDADGLPRAAVTAVVQVLRAAGLDDWTLALWWTTPLDFLDWRRPLDVIDDHPDAALAAARADAEAHA